MLALRYHHFFFLKQSLTRLNLIKGSAGWPASLQESTRVSSRGVTSVYYHVQIFFLCDFWALTWVFILVKQTLD